MVEYCLLSIQCHTLHVIKAEPEADEQWDVVAEREACIEAGMKVSPAAHETEGPEDGHRVI